MLEPEMIAIEKGTLAWYVQRQIRSFQVGGITNI